MSDSLSDCIFCKIAAGEFATDFVMETDLVVAFDDLSPQAPTHVLIVPRQHVSSIAHLTADDRDLIVEVTLVINRVARLRGIDATGYRVVTNSGADAGQTVSHLHWHLLGGAPMGPIA
jgi:histidine triad (HIT) family protein